VFLSPLFLAGLGALSIPVIIHLMHSTKAEVIKFGSIRFLKNCQRRAARRTRLKQLVLLALRMLLLALIVLGLAKPVLHTEQTIAAEDLSVAMVLIIDNSYSMGYTDQGKTRLEQAKGVALELLDSLKKGDQAAVIVFNDKAEPYIKDFTADIDSVKAAIPKIKLTTHGTDAAPALNDAYAMLRFSDTSIHERPARREVHLLTDLQESSWRKLLEKDFIKDEPEPRPKLYISSFGQPKSHNTYIRGITVTGLAAAGVASRVTAEVETVGLGSPENVATLSVGGEKKEQTAFTVLTGSPAQVPLEVQFDAAGTYRCSISLNEDSLAVDDVFDFTLTVDDRVTVLCVDGDPSSIASVSETFFLRAALNPSSLTGMRAGSEIEPTAVTLAELPGTSLDNYRCVILCNVPRLDGNELIRLELFLDSGGSLIIFLGNRVNAQEYNAWRFLPVQLTKAVGRGDRSSFFSFGRVNPNHPVFAGMGDLRTAKVFCYFETDAEHLPDGARVVASLRNGSPVLVERDYGRGRVLMATTAADIEWTNVPLRRIYVPLVHRMVTYMSGRRSTSHAFHVGDAVEFRALAKHYDKAITVKAPDGRETLLRPKIEGSYAVASFSETLEPGLYKVTAPPDFSNAEGFTVNPDVRESDITMVATERLEEEFKGLDVTVLSTPGKVVQTVMESREGWKLWPLLFKLGLLFFCVEILVANLFSRTVEYEGVQMQWFDYLKLRRGGLSE